MAKASGGTQSDLPHRSRQVCNFTLTERQKLELAELFRGRPLAART